jgi:hypothetical protein
VVTEMSTVLWEDDMTEPLKLEYRILANNGAGWYWEVVTQNREAIARGLAVTHNQARIDAMSAGLDQRPLETLDRKLA